MQIIPALKMGYQNMPEVAASALFAWFCNCIHADVPAGKRRNASARRPAFLRNVRAGSHTIRVNNHAAGIAEQPSVIDDITGHRAALRPGGAGQLATLLLLACLPAAAAAFSACVVPAASGEAVAVPVFADPVRLTAVPAGANTLYFLEDDKYWAQGNAQAALRAAGMRSLRFPGGEVADNYDWQTRSLANPKIWPGEPADRAALDARTDYLEFLAQAKAVGASDLFFVVNMDSAFRASGNRDDNLRVHARKAAAWVKAVRDAGHRVQYWEIGNEPYLSSSYPLTAAEYAAALQVYAKEMRAADPGIRIGATGPEAGSTVGFADQLSAGQHARLRKGGGKQGYCGAVTNKECIVRLAKENPGSADQAAWWPTLAKLAGDSFDVAIIHLYESTDLKAGTEKALLNRASRLRHFAQDLQHLAGRPVPVMVTEWNTPNERSKKAVAAEKHLLDIAVQYGNLMVGGVTHAHYWPLQSPGGEARTFLDRAGHAQAPAALFRLYSDIQPGDSVAHAVPARGIYALEYRRDSGVGHVFVNTTRKPKQLHVPAGASATAEVEGIRTGTGAALAACESQPANGEVKVVLPPHSVLRVRQFRAAPPK